MKICYFADGRYIHAERWMRYFAKRGHEMHLISFAEISSRRAKELSQIGAKYHGATGNFHIKRFWLTLRDQRFLNSVLRKNKIDILHCHFLGANCWQAAISGFHPYIVTVMGGGDVTGPEWGPDSSRREKLLTPYTLRKADYITSWSLSMAETIRPFCGNTPIEVIHGGVQLERFKPGDKLTALLEQHQIPKDAAVVFSPRLMRPLSNIDKFAVAAGRIIAERPHTFFVIARPDHVIAEDYARQVTSILEENGAVRNTRFVGSISHDMIADYFRLADVTVSIPSTDGTPMTVLESMACGIPTVIGDLPDYDTSYFENEKTTLMVDVNDPDSIANGILRLLRDEQFSTGIAAQARHIVEETGSYEYQMAKMENIYERVVMATSKGRGA